MSDILQVQYSTMQTAHDNLVANFRTIQSSLEDLNGVIRSTMGDLQSEDADQYRALQSQWNTASDQMANMLNMHGQNVAYAAELYNGTDRRLAGSWGGTIPGVQA